MEGRRKNGRKGSLPRRGRGEGWRDPTSGASTIEARTSPGRPAGDGTAVGYPGGLRGPLAWRRRGAAPPLSWRISFEDLPAPSTSDALGGEEAAASEAGEGERAGPSSPGTGGERMEEASSSGPIPMTRSAGSRRGGGRSPPSWPWGRSQAHRSDPNTAKVIMQVANPSSARSDTCNSIDRLLRRESKLFHRADCMNLQIERSP